MKIHFISGLPRSGSTLLSAILNQNPAFRAAMSSPVSDMFGGLIRSLSASEFAMFASEEQRKRVLRCAVEAYYAEVSGSEAIFDTSRGWCNLLPALAGLFPCSRVICMLRSPAQILDSFERLVQRNPYQASKMYPPDCFNVYSRVDALLKGTVGQALNSVKQVWHGEHAPKLIAIRYDSLAAQPAEVMRRLYEILEEPWFQHDFCNVGFDAAEFDARLNMPGLHSVSGQVQRQQRHPVLPEDLFRTHDKCFWDAPQQNPRGVTIL